MSGLMKTRKWLSRALIVAMVCGFSASATAQDDTRPAGTTFLGDTGLWFVPTAEVLGNGSVAASGHVATFNHEQGFTAIQSMNGSFAAGFNDRFELFGSVRFLTRVDRDLRPLFQESQSLVGGPVNDFPLVNTAFSSNQFGDVVLGGKVNILSEQNLAPAAVAIRSWVKVPTGDERTTLDGAIGIVVSKAFGAAELSGHSDFVYRADTAVIDQPNSLRWGIGVGGPVRGSVRVFGELIGDLNIDNSITLKVPLTGTDGSISGLSHRLSNPVYAVLGAQWQSSNGVSIGGGLTFAARHVSRSLVGQAIPSAERIGFLFRLNYHPGVKVYVPPPPPPPPPDMPNREPTVSVSCDPCEVQFGEEVRLRADASDPDGDRLTYRWSSPVGDFQDSANRATTRWEAPEQAGPVPINVTVTDGRGGSGSDTANIRVNAPPEPVREYVFEDVHFDFDRYSLRPGAVRVLDEVVAAFEEDANLRIEIEGHTCNIGTNEYNLALGDRRANSVQEYLTSRGVGGNQLQIVSYGEERPDHDNSREETRRLNRRAALVVRVQ